MRAVSFNQEPDQDYRDFFENMLTGTIVLEVIYDGAGIPVDHRLLRANAQFEVQTGLKREQEIGKTSAQLSFNWPDEVRQEYYSIAERGGSLYWERYNESLETYYDVHVFSPNGHGQCAAPDDETQFCRRPIHRAIFPKLNRPMNRPPTTHCFTLTTSPQKTTLTTSIKLTRSFLDTERNLVVSS